MSLLILQVLLPLLLGKSNRGSYARIDAAQRGKFSRSLKTIRLDATDPYSLVLEEHGANLLAYRAMDRGIGVMHVNQGVAALVPGKHDGGTQSAVSQSLLPHCNFE